MAIAVGDLLLTDDGGQWRIRSIINEGSERTFTAVHVSSRAVMAGDVATLRWSESEGAWRLS